MTSTPAIPDQTDVTTELYKSVIGPVNQSYYLRVFAHFDAKGKTGILWHWSAFFTTLNWLIFRKMWGMAAWFAGLSLVFTLVVFGIGKLVFSYSETTEGILAGLTLVAVFVVPGLFANAAYYRFCERTINGALVTGVGVPGACEMLAKRASSPRRLLALGALNLVALALFIALLSWVPGARLDGKMPSLTPEFPPGLTPGLAPVKPPPVATSVAVAARPSAPASDSFVAPVEPAGSAPVAAPARGAESSVQAASSAKLPSVPSISQPVMSSPVTSSPGLPMAKPAVSSSSAVTVAKHEPAGGMQKPVPAPAPAPPPAPAPAPAPPPAPPPAPAPTHVSGTDSPVAQQYFIQVGAFANLQNARKTMTQLEAMGLDAGAAPVVVEDGRLTRIRVGPFKTRPEARKAADKIKAQGLPALFVKL
jgi:cell division protein FtsN